jgi:hypothetical protein
METVFRIKVSELNAGFLKTLKNLFKNESEVEIVIHPTGDDDETSYLMSTPANRKSLEKSLAEAKSGNLKEVKLNKLK